MSTKQPKFEFLQSICEKMNETFRSIKKLEKYRFSIDETPDGEYSLRVEKVRGWYIVVGNLIIVPTRAELYNKMQEISVKILSEAKK